MSDWEDFCDSMGWANDEHATDRLIDYIDSGNEKEKEESLREDGYKTLKEWNAIGRSVKKGEKGICLPYAKIRVFSESQTSPTNFSCNSNSSGYGKMHFDTFEKASSWAKENPGKPFTRSPDGNGFIEK